jgi:hypothetical protein
MRRRDPALRLWLEAKASNLLALQSRSESTAAEVRRVLGARMTGGDMRIEAVAKSMATTPRTLQKARGRRHVV